MAHHRGMQIMNDDVSNQPVRIARPAPAAAERLDQACTYLEDLDDADFDMSKFADTASGIEEPPPIDVLNHCATAWCLAGHIPIIAPQWTRDLLEEEPTTNWAVLAARFAGITDVFPDQATQNKGWEWLYGEDWQICEPGPQGAVQRIRVYVDGRIPERFCRDGFEGYRNEEGEIWENPLAHVMRDAR